MPSISLFLSNAPEILWPFLFSGGTKPANGAVGLAMLAGYEVPWSDIIIVCIVGLATALAMIAIFIFKGFWKRSVTNKVRSIHEYGMNMSDLDGMKNTGLLTEEEFAIIKQRQAAKIREEIERERKLQEESKKNKPGLKAKSKPADAPPDGFFEGMDPKLAAALTREGNPLKPGLDARGVEEQLRAQIAAQGGEAPAPPPAAGQRQMPAPAQIQSGKSSASLDADELLKRGLVTFEEYERIKSHVGKN